MSDPAKIRIVNQALYLTGQEPVTDLEDASLQASVAAVKVLRVLDQARDVILNRHGWVSALDYKTLAPAVGDGFSNWKYPTAFLVPQGAQRIWEIAGQIPLQAAFPGNWGPSWQVGTVETADAAQWVIRAAATACGGVLDSLNVAFVRKANWASLATHVGDAIAFEAAARSAYSITAERGIASDLAKRAEQNVMLAIGVDGTQEGGEAPAAPSIPAALRAYSR